MKKKYLLVVLCFLLFTLTGCVNLNLSRPAREETAIFLERNDAVFSPEGSVLPGKVAFSPDGQFYARELEPVNEGVIGIFNNSDNTLLLRIKAQKTNNDLKGLAWSADSKLLAVMYHGGDPDGISIYLAETGDLLRHISIDRHYHFLAFGKQNHILHLAVSLQDPVETICLRKDKFTSFCGVNLPWINYGWDVGRHPWNGKHGGFATNRSRLFEDFSLLAKHQVKVVRVFIFCDLRSGFFFNLQGEPVALDNYVMTDFQTLLDVASSTGLKLIPVLFDYTIADGRESENGIKVGEYPSFLEDPIRRRKLLAVLAPFFHRFGQHPGILAWDIFNEPDNIVLVSEADIDCFLTETVSFLKKLAPKAAVTIGGKNIESFSRWKYLPVDFLQFHHFSSSENLPRIDRRKQVFLPALPVLIGECSPSTVVSQLQAAWEAGYEGCLFWSLNDILEENESLRSQLPFYQAWVSVH